MAPSQTEPSLESLVDLVMMIHERRRFIRDPSPQVLAFGENGSISIAETDLESRSHTDIPGLSLVQLWSLMPFRPADEKLAAGKLYTHRRGMNVDLDAELRRFVSMYLNRCLHENRDFKVIQLGGMVWHVRRDRFRDAHEAILADPDRFLAHGSKLLKDGASTTVAAAPGETLLKRFNLKKYRSLVKHHFAPSRAQTAFQRAAHLELHGIPTPRPIAFAERRVLGWLYRSYLLTEFLPEMREVDQACRDWSWCDESVRHRSLINVGFLVGRLHECGFANRDLKARNILVSPDGEAWLIDLDGLSPGERVNPETRLKNLRRMVRDLKDLDSLTQRDRLRFLKAYARTVGAAQASFYFRKLAEEPW